MITFPNAKINLGLNIIEKRPDVTTTWKPFSTPSTCKMHWK